MQTADFLSSFCTQTASILRFVGWVLTIVKVAIPLLIIGFGIMDFGKAVVGSDEKVIQGALKSLGMRIVAGLFIFFIPSIIMWLFSLVAAYQNADDGFSTCESCILKPWACNVTITDAY